VESNKVIFTGQAWVVEGAVSSEAIIASLTQEAERATHNLLLTTGVIGEGRAAAHAAMALQHSGISGIIAPAFAWPFFRICLNIGLPPLTVWEAEEIRRGDRLRVDLQTQVVKNLSSGTRYPIRDLSELYVTILASGGITGYIRLLRGEQAAIPLKGND